MLNLFFPKTKSQLFKNSIKNSKKLFSTAIKSIPIIDLKPLIQGTEIEKRKVGLEIDQANKEIGFFLIKNTGIDFGHVRKTLDICEEFFLSPLENKLKSRIDDTPENKPWGYFPRGTEQLQRGKDHDLTDKNKRTYLNDVNEQFNMQNDHPKANLAKRIYPQHPKEFEPAFSKYFKDCEMLSNKLMEGFAYGLNLNPDFSERNFNIVPLF
jgi:isopenicillin N synthase-like dioxygenase